MSIIPVNRSELTQLFRKNDHDGIKKFLDQCGLDHEGKNRDVCTGMLMVVSDIMKIASAMAYDYALSFRLAEELLIRVARVINIFDFIETIWQTGVINEDDEDFDDIPRELRNTLLSNVLSDGMAGAITAMGKKEFKILLAFIHSGKIQTLDVGYNAPLIKRIFAEKIIPDPLLFAYLGLSVHTLPYRSRVIGVAIPVSSETFSAFSDDDEDDE